MEGHDARAVGREVLAALADAGGDMGEMTDALPALQAYVDAWAAPDFECAMVPRPPTPEVVYPGPEGLSRAWAEWGGAFASVRAELEEIVESDDHVLLLVRQVAVTRHDRVELTQPSAMVWKFRDGRIARLEFHLDRAAAAHAAGIDPRTLRS